MQRSINQFFKTKWLFLSLGILLFLGILLVQGSRLNLNAQTTVSFTNDSLKGNYALIDTGNGGQPNAGATLINFDGQGKFTGSTTQNFPGTNAGIRTLGNATFTGSYTLDKQGTGTGQIITNLPNGATSTNNLNFVITKVKIDNNSPQVEELFLIPQNLTPAGGLETVVGKRLPDEGTFSNASLQGKYSYTLIGEGGQTPLAGLGLINCDGKGNCSGNIALNQPGATSGERTVTTASLEGSYTINANGTGTANPPNDNETVLLITQAEVVNTIKRAEEVFFIVNDLDSDTGNFITGFLRRLPD